MVTDLDEYNNTVSKVFRTNFQASMSHYDDKGTLKGHFLAILERECTNVEETRT